MTGFPGNQLAISHVQQKSVLKYSKTVTPRVTISSSNFATTLAGHVKVMWLCSSTVVMAPAGLRPANLKSSTLMAKTKARMTGEVYKERPLETYLDG